MLVFFSSSAKLWQNPSNGQKYLVRCLLERLFLCVHIRSPHKIHNIFWSLVGNFRNRKKLYMVMRIKRAIRFRNTSVFLREWETERGTAEWRGSEIERESELVNVWWCIWKFAFRAFEMAKKDECKVARIRNHHMRTCYVLASFAAIVATVAIGVAAVIVGAILWPDGMSVFLWWIYWNRIFT